MKGFVFVERVRNDLCRGKHEGWNMNYESWTIGLRSAVLAQSVGHTLQLSAQPSLISALEVIPLSF